MRQKMISAMGNALVDGTAAVERQKLTELRLTEGLGGQRIGAPELQRLFTELGAQNVKWSFGGSAGNTIYSIGQLDDAASFTCAVGSDKYGREYLRALESVGVDVRASVIREGRTGMVVVLTTPPRGERTMITDLGVAGAISRQDVPTSCIRNSAWLLLEVYQLAGTAQWMPCAARSKSRTDRTARAP